MAEVEILLALAFASKMMFAMVQSNAGDDQGVPPPASISHSSADDSKSDDPRRDPMAPPPEPCECFCLHCGRTFTSDKIWFQKVNGAKDGFPGFWMCPTPNCSGAGFTFDIFPTDPDHPANEGWHQTDDDALEEEDALDEETLSDDEPLENSAEDDQEWDPREASYRAMDEWEDEDDIEGEEWKYGLPPGARPDRDDEGAGRSVFDEPDRRPRELDWSDRDDRTAGPGEDEIPY